MAKRMAVTDEDRNEVIINTELAIAGGRIPLIADNPFNPGAVWYMRQPTDTEYDLALAVRDAVRGRVLNEPEMQEAKSLPPSDEWTSTQMEAIKATGDKIAELQESLKGSDNPSPIDQTLLAILKDHQASLVKPADYSLALEIATRTANRGFQNYLIPRLLIDANGDNYLNMMLPEHRERWDKLGRGTKLALRLPFSQMLSIINTAKN